MKKLDLTIFMAGLGLVACTLSGCNVGPTYGTGKTSGQQLMDDVSSLASLRPRVVNNQVKTRPRPELVPPATGARAQLPPPQEHVAKADSVLWPESPEERRQRLRNEVTANQDNPGYVSPIKGEMARYERRRGTDLSRSGDERVPVIARAEEQAQRSAYQRQRQENMGGTSTQRKYLSEPPLAYRQPAEGVPTDDLGTSEAEKERKRKAAINKKETKRWWPF